MNTPWIIIAVLILTVVCVVLGLAAVISSWWKEALEVEADEQDWPDWDGVDKVLDGVEATTSKDWSEDFHLENGNYSNKCCNCKATFTGHKRRLVCKVCANRVRD